MEKLLKYNSWSIKNQKHNGWDKQQAEQIKKEYLERSAGETFPEEEETVKIREV